MLSDSPAGYWRLGEASGTTAADSAASNPGTYTNAPQLGAASLIGSDTANKAVRFDGVNDHVAIPNSGSLSPTARVSLEAWIKPAALPGTGSFATIASKREAYALQFNGPRLEFTIMQGGVRRRAQAPVGAIQTGQTYHVAGTYDGTTSRLYINGTEVAALPLTGAIGTTSAGLNIGSWTGGNEFLNGTVDDVAVYPHGAHGRPCQGSQRPRGNGAPPPPPPVAAPSNLNATAASSQPDRPDLDRQRDERDRVRAPALDQRELHVADRDPDPRERHLATRTPAGQRRRPTTTASRRRTPRPSRAGRTPPTPRLRAARLPVVAAPTSLTATPISSSQINLAWTDNANNETGYTLERSADSGFTSPTSIALPANAAELLRHGPRGVDHLLLPRQGAERDARSRAGPTPPTPRRRAPRRRPRATPAPSARTTRWPGGGWARRRGRPPWTRRPPTRAPTSTGPCWERPACCASDTANKAVSFDGANDHVRVPNSLALQLTTPITLEAWIKPTALPAAGGFASIVSKPEQYSLQFNGPLLEFTIIQMGARRRLQAPAGTVAIRRHLPRGRHVRRGHPPPVRERHAGRRICTLTGGATATANNVFMGSWSGSNEFLRGTIDEVAIYNTALSAARVQAHRTAGG